MFSSEFFFARFICKTKQKKQKCLICYTGGEQFYTKFLKNYVATIF